MATTTTTTGLNVSGIPKMKAAIAAYKNKIAKVAADIGAKQSVVHNAIQGDQTVKDLEIELNMLQMNVRALMGELDKYVSYLDQLKGSYSKQDKENSSFIQLVPGELENITFYKDAK